MSGNFMRENREASLVSGGNKPDRPEKEPYALKCARTDLRGRPATDRG